VASGQGFEAAPVPSLLLRPGEFSATVGLVASEGACFLTRPQLVSDAPFELGMRGLGASPALVERAVGTLRRWDERGRPSTAGMRVRVSPMEAPPPASADAIILEKRWHRYALDWPAHSQTSR